MNDQENQTPVEHDNRWIVPYLKAILAKQELGMSSAECDEVFPNLVEEGAEAPATPGKIRQTMYIAKLARKEKGSDTLFVTEKGLELIEQVDNAS